VRGDLIIAIYPGPHSGPLWLMKSAARGSRLLGLGSGFAESLNPDRFLLQWIAALPPGFKAPQQRAHAGDSLAFEQERHTGAGGFARSSAVEHDVAVAGNFQVTLPDFLGVQVYGSG